MFLLCDCDKHVLILCTIQFKSKRVQFVPIMNKFKTFYQIVCALGAVGMTSYCIRKYIKNENIAIVNHREFHVGPEDIYPSTTICLFNYDFGPFKDHHSMNKTELFKMMKGLKRYDHTLLGNLSYEDLTININDYVTFVKYKVNEDDYVNIHCNSTCFKSSGGDSTMKCFSHDIKFQQNMQIHSLYFYVDENIREILRTQMLRFYFHHPGQLIRNGLHPAVRKFFLQNMTELAFSIQSLTVLRRREDGNTACSSSNMDDDKIIWEKAALGFNCTSIYPGKRLVHI